ncbi:MAG: NAD-dependent epimerase/dehydratase family protein [Polaromonas sp.]|uniref:NAD-dependent epimerase/dehydratase family protein n=1 Tax=Polaromonas sp. TaxID=1869339 RepID=UPI001854C075|nr:NAD-dependent epimerase/dehydratase family protein [Polaromonas sp.]NMM11015.1 NAD-dependent epimerase/dehydratase family protein [Polaromonas sp.]
MPSNLTPLGALPSRFRRERVLIVGCGDVGLRVARQLPPKLKLIALTSTAARLPALRAEGITPLQGNLDDAATLRRLAGLATRVVHLAPPPNHNPDWRSDPRTLALLRTLRLRSLPRSLVYGSTSGVYGDCGGDWVSETRSVNPHTPRSQRRVHAEGHLRLFGRATGTKIHILRIPGIYASDREGGTPRERLLKGTPVLRQEDDVYTNHIHADDLARACLAALWRGKPQRVTHVSDDTRMKMGDYFDLAADLYQLPRPPRAPRSTAQQQLSLMLLSFMSESRRLNNQRMKTELKLVLRYPTVASGLRAA